MDVFWKGASGRQYEYKVYELVTQWNDFPGNYIFTQWTQNGWRAIYIGQTDTFQTRMPHHERLAEAMRLGATHIHAHVNNGGERARRAEEEDLIQLHRPPCNGILYAMAD